MRGLPPGFRFEPTEEELVFEYLKCKVFSFALPASIIPEISISVGNLDPWDIPGGGGDWEEDRYLFSKKLECYNLENYGSGKVQRRIRWTPSGYWKARGSDRKIVSSSSDVAGLVGMRKTLVFCIGSGSSRKTGWVMHEYRLLFSPTDHPQAPTPPSVVIKNMEKWVVCRVFCKNLVKNGLQFHPSISSTKDDHGMTTNALSDDSVSSTASSSSTSATFTDFTSPTTAMPNHRSSASN